ncbi:MAG: adenylate/guanylate cyclase domain-containing protein [Halanaerobiales bacterium]|nr:adenylate/guanylate cyclase domain-containing protein [Halanaerobiales bacterium]
MIDYKFNTRKIIIYALIILVVIIGYYYNNFKSIDNFIYDTYQRIEYIFNIGDNESAVTVLEINELSLDKLGNWPLDRNYYVEAIKKLNQENVNIITFDILFADSKDIQTDSLLLDILRENNNIVMPVIMDLKMTRGIGDQSITVDQIEAPLPSFKNLVKLGHINLIPDKDGIIRKLPPLLIKENESYLPISRQSSELALGEEINITQGDYLINYQGPSNTIPKISLRDFLNDNYDKNLIDDKIVIMGVTASGLGDQFMTSFSRYGYTNGVELHAQLINNYYNQNFIKVNDVINIIFIAFLGLAFIFYLFEKFNPFKSLIMLISLYLLIISLNFYLTIKYHFFTEISVFLVGMTVIYIVSVISWYWLSRKQKRQLETKLKPYFSSYLLKKIVENPDILKNEGEKTLATVMFFDFRNFTKFSEQNSPEKVIKDLNHSYNDLSKIIFKYDGVIDKFLGDGILAYWTKSLDQKNHRNRAVKTSIEIMNYFKNKNMEIKPSIALNTGRVILGDLGSKDRMDFTIMGDTVNRTSKLADITLPYELQVGENTFYGLSDIYKELKWKYKEIELKGIEESFVVYSLKNFDDFKKGE